MSECSRVVGTHLRRVAVAYVRQSFGVIFRRRVVVFVLSGIAAAAAIQELYERAFDLETRGIKDTPRRLGWLALLLGFAALVSWAGPSVHAAGGPVLLALLALLALTCFWWFTMWLLLAGRIPWRALFPSALATGICWLAMSVVFNLTMSSTITSNYTKYGDIGVVLSLMSFLIAIGVVIILGATIGVVWRLRRTSTPDSGSTGDSHRHRPARQPPPQNVCHLKSAGQSWGS
jgi:membrane protein